MHKAIVEEEHMMEILLKLINKEIENSSTMSSQIKQNAKMLKKKDDCTIGKLRMISTIETELQIAFRMLMKHRMRSKLEDKKLISNEQGGGRRRKKQIRKQ